MIRSTSSFAKHHLLLSIAFIFPMRVALAFRLKLREGSQEGEDAIAAQHKDEDQWRTVQITTSAGINEEYKYLITKPLKEGAQGSIFRAKKAIADHEKEYVLKIMELSTLRQKELATHEQKVYDLLQHHNPISSNNHGDDHWNPNVAQVIGWSVSDIQPPAEVFPDADADSSFFYLVMEHCPGRDLYHHILSGFNYEKGLYTFKRLANPGQFNGETQNEAYLLQDLDLAREIMTRILHAVADLHDKGIVHRDLKPENIMLDFDPDANNEIKALKIIDFGFAVDYRDEENTEELRESCGTEAFIAPELLQEESSRIIIPDKLDVWSLGSVLYALLFGDWLDLDRHMKSVQGTEDIDPDYYIYRELSGDEHDPNDLRGLLFGMLRFDPEKRFSARECLEHRWFAEKDRSVGEGTKEDTEEAVSTASSLSPPSGFLSCDVEE